MLKAQHLVRQYGSVTAVNNVSFEIDQQQIVGLLGHNGAGKTTIMKMMTGFLEPGSGSISIDGVDVNQYTAATQARVGYLPENCPLYLDMTVIDFLLYVTQLRHMPYRSARRAVQQTLVRTDIGSKACQKIQTLSRGYRQRVGVAQAILSEPSILILDEPTNGLDPSQVENMRSLIKQLAQTTTVIISTHVLQEVSAVCDRVLILKQGELALDSTLENLQQGDQLLITVDRPPEQLIAQLQDHVVVQTIEYLGQDQTGYSYRLSPAGSNTLVSIVPEITRTLVQCGYNVTRITPERRDLESIFREINLPSHVALQ
ncbi:MAG TPA: ABC transporter ATP-binding protein [Crenotrichaceae bacterium]|nr:ABC transporter ATP-binding protein [Crenotrichaceae bacterium]